MSLSFGWTISSSKKINKFYRCIVRSSIPEPSHGLGYAIYTLCDIFYPSLVSLCRPIYGNPYSGIQKSYLVKYGILGFGIWNKTQGIWIPLTAGIQNPIKQVPLTKNPEFSTWNPEWMTGVKLRIHDRLLYIMMAFFRAF